MRVPLQRLSVSCWLPGRVWAGPVMPGRPSQDTRCGRQKPVFLTWCRTRALLHARAVPSGARARRGFAFVDFLTKQEAAAAAAAVAGTHLYGRRLVVEWAAAEDGLDELRAKTAARSRAGDDAAPAPPAKRRKAR
jgi:hypothetical protein